MRLWTSLCGCLLALILAGCGSNDDLARVEGTIKLDGEPLPNAFVVFNPTSGGTTSYGKTDEQGRYYMVFDENQDGAWIGENRVRIRTGDVGAAEEGGTKEVVPAAYNTDSTLLVNVEPGDNTFDFDLSSEEGEVDDVTVE